MCCPQAVGSEAELGLWRKINPHASVTWLIRALETMREDHDNYQISEFLEEIRRIREARRR